jgi:hypothetical protein
MQISEVFLSIMNGLSSSMLLHFVLRRNTSHVRTGVISQAKVAEGGFVK